jgi:DNA-binding response OmpR family regulator
MAVLSRSNFPPLDARHEVPPKRVLVVEDEHHIAQGLRFNLESEGYHVQVIDTGEAAEQLLLGSEPDAFDLLVLDVMLPGKDGFDVISSLRAAGQFIPTLMLTARGRPEDVLRGFEAGADDYLPKPFELPILIARINGLLRRRDWMRPRRPPQDVYEFSGRIIDFDNLELHVGATKLQLTLMEANLLRYLIRNEGSVVSRKSLLDEVWGVREDTDTRAIDNFIVRLRKYIEPEPARPRHLLTVRGVGYRFVAQPV